MALNITGLLFGQNFTQIWLANIKSRWPCLIYEVKNVHLDKDTVISNLFTDTVRTALSAKPNVQFRADATFPQNNSAVSEGNFWHAHF